MDILKKNNILAYPKKLLKVLLKNNNLKVFLIRLIHIKGVVKQKNID